MFNLAEVTTIEKLLAEVEAANLTLDAEKIQAAYKFAAARHGDERRKSGDPVLWHLLTVAAYIVRLRLDTTSVVAALLHEVIEKQVGTLQELDDKFGSDVALIIDGITDLKRQTSTFQTHNEHPENFRRLLLNATDDVRGLIIRLANKLHNTGTWKFLAPIRMQNQANKTLLVYAPLCEYLGLGQFLEIFQERAFAALHPHEFKLVQNFVKASRGEAEDRLQQLNEELMHLLSENNVRVQASSFRTKNLYSAYKKILRKYLLPGEELQEKHMQKLKDILGIRLLIEGTDQCYLTLGLLHDRFEFDSDEFDDYILQPRANGYKSIHTVIYYLGSPVEIQIRTPEMHDYNEFGPASHIAYKTGTQAIDSTWTKELVEWQNSEQQQQDKFKVKAFSESIFVFTPQGKIVRLAIGASPLDFAYAVHTDVGDRFRGALVNKVMRPMSHELKTGDIVEILTNKQPNVNADWLKYVKMPYTRSHIQKKLRIPLD